MTLKMGLIKVLDMVNETTSLSVVGAFSMTSSSVSSSAVPNSGFMF